MHSMMFKVGLAFIALVALADTANGFSRATFFSVRPNVLKSLIRSSMSEFLEPTDDMNSSRQRRNIHDQSRDEWISRSVEYYSKVMREERRRNIGQLPDNDEPGYQEKFVHLAKKHYFALRKIKSGKLQHAEQIYRKIIDDLLREDEEEGGHCDHAKLAVTTLLLALLMQRMGDRKGTRSVFLNFFRIAVLDNDDTECACSAKVLQAYALFEMKQGNTNKSLEIVNRAIRFDQSLAPVLQWKQFRDVMARRSQAS